MRVISYKVPGQYVRIVIELCRGLSEGLPRDCFDKLPFQSFSEERRPQVSVAGDGTRIVQMSYKRFRGNLYHSRFSRAA